MAVKIVRQANKIALLGSPTSAAAMSAGHEAAPSALRSAGLAERLQSIGYEVTDLGDDPPQVYKPDDESPRARNIRGVLASLEALKPRVEQAVKSGALPLILSGDCSVVLATIAGMRRYFRHVSLIFMDRDADLNTPATTSSGCVDGMVISHVTGRGAAELVRFWGEPPLVREPDVALFGVERIEPAEEQVLRNSPLRCYPADDIRRKRAAAAAQAAIDRVHGAGSEIVLHLDVDVIDGFQATNYPGTGGLSLEEVREALGVFAKHKNICAIDVAGYNPAKDSDGSGANLVVDLLAGFFKARQEALRATPGPEQMAAAAGQSAEGSAGPARTAETEPLPPLSAPEETWSSDSIESESKAGHENPEPPSTTGEADDPHS